MDLGSTRRLFDLGLGRPVAPIADVIADRIVEQHRILRHHSDHRMQAFLRHVAHVLAINQNRPRLHIIEAKQQPPDGRFPRARRADNRNRLTGRDIKRNPLQNRPLAVITEIHGLKSHRCAFHF